MIRVHYAGRKEPADAVVAEIQKTGGEAFAVQADIRNSAAVKALFDAAIAKYGRIDVVVNNAGIMITKVIKDFTDEDFVNQVNINLNGAFFVLQRYYQGNCLRSKKDEGGGSTASAQGIEDKEVAGGR